MHANRSGKAVGREDAPRLVMVDPCQVAPRCWCRLRVYDLPPDVLEQPGLGAKGKRSDNWAEAPDNLPAVLCVDEGETVYDYAWYPGALASDPATSVFAATSRVRPLAPAFLHWACTRWWAAVAAAAAHSAAGHPASSTHG